MSSLDLAVWYATLGVYNRRSYCAVILNYKQANAMACAGGQPPFSKSPTVSVKVPLVGQSYAPVVLSGSATTGSSIYSKRARVETKKREGGSGTFSRECQSANDKALLLCGMNKTEH
jgi:hypothetical protein